MAGKAVDYAEGTLGVHLVYDRAQEAADEFDKAVAEILEHRAAKVLAEERLSELEAELMTDVWVNHSDTSQAARDRLLKASIAENPLAKELRRQIAATGEQIALAEGKRDAARIRCQVHTSRMTELGGYLIYLAEVKRAATTAT